MNSKFSTYATYWFRQEINRAINNEGLLVYVPDNRASAMGQLLYKHQAENKEVDVFSLKQSDKFALIALLPPLSLQASNDADSPELSLRGALADNINNTPRADLERRDPEKVIEMLLTCLSRRERLIIEARFGLNGHDQPLTLREVKDKIGITREGVRQAQNRALESLRRFAKKLGLSLESVGL
ncbi:MAG: sigma-70 family RNA polymerase sigma factor, partial [Patescibacteria group bacterium]